MVVEVGPLAVGAGGRRLPLRLGRQARARPAGEGIGLMPVDVDDRMDKAIQHLKQQLSGIRTGRANPGLVDTLKVEVYGSLTPMKSLASVGAPEPQQIVIRPYDPGTIKEIERAIEGIRTKGCLVDPIELNVVE